MKPQKVNLGELRIGEYFTFPYVDLEIPILYKVIGNSSFNTVRIKNMGKDEELLYGPYASVYRGVQGIIYHYCGRATF